MSNAKLFVVEVLCDESETFEIEEVFPDEENAVAFQRSLEEEEAVVTRLTVYNLEPQEVAGGVVCDYSQSHQPSHRVKEGLAKPEKKEEPSYSWRKISQNPYAYADLED